MRYNDRLRDDCRDDCRERTGPVYDHADSLSTVRDLDAIRIALGEKRLTFHGSSYGTLAGEQYAEEHPHGVRAEVLEGVVDDSLERRVFLRTQAATAQDSFDEFVAWCDRSTDCVLHGKDVRELWAALLRRAERGELADPEAPGKPIDAFTLSGLAQRELYDPTWPELAQLLAKLDSSKPPSGNRVTAATGVEPNPMAVFCQDWNLPIDSFHAYQRQRRQLSRVAPDMRYPMQLQAATTCLGAPAPVSNPQHRLDVDGSKPLLLTNSLHDPATGYDRATNVAKQLGGEARLLTYEGWGHGTYSTSPCARRLIDRYLITGRAPARDTTCPAIEPPPGR